MASSKVLLYKSKKKADGRYPIAIRIIKDRKPKYIYIDWIFESDWDEEKVKVKHSHPNSKRINNLILKRLVEADDLILESEAQRKDFTAGQITKMIKGKRKAMTFFKRAKEFIDDLEKAGKYNRANADGARIKIFKEFVGEDISFHEIDEYMLKKFRVYLISIRKVSERTIMNYYVVIRTLFNLAISEGIVEQKYYPFGKKKIKIKFPGTIKIGLDEKEIKEIEALDLITGTPIYHARNIFLFSFYFAGVRISDVLRMRWSDIKNDRLYYKMGKNDKVDTLKIPEKANDIIRYYKNDQESPTDFIFPELKKANLKDPKDIHAKIRTATKKFNNYLTQITKLSKINKKATNHISRHSFGNIAGDKMIPIQMLQKLYRHTAITTTIGYQGSFIHKSADEALDTVVNFGMRSRILKGKRK